jgi:predicted component of type VI protein secretion system
MPPASHRLTVRTGPNPGMTFDLTKEVMMIGRDITNDIVIGDAEISRQHARLTRTPAGFILEDLGSTNGSFVNGERIVAARALSAGNTIAFGENVSLMFEATSPEAAPTVMSPAVVRTAVPPPMPAGRVAAQPTPVPMPGPGKAAGPAAPGEAGTPVPTTKRPWLLAGCGCMVLAAACLIFLWAMDAYAPDILYAPLRMLGF